MHLVRAATLCAALGFVPAAAHAQYRCVAPDGAVSVQQQPCPAGAAATRLALPPPALERPEHIRAAIARGHFVVGMTRAEIDRSAGRGPQQVNRTITANATLDQLVFGGVGYTRTVYVHLRNGIVESVSAYDSGR